MNWSTRSCTYSTPTVWKCNPPYWRNDHANPKSQNSLVFLHLPAAWCICFLHWNVQSLGPTLPIQPITNNLHCISVRNRNLQIVNPKSSGGSCFENMLVLISTEATFPPSSNLEGIRNADLEREMSHRNCLNAEASRMNALHEASPLRLAMAS